MINNSLEEKIIMRNINVEQTHQMTIKWMVNYGFKIINNRCTYIKGEYHYSKPRYAKIIQFTYTNDKENININVKISPKDPNYNVNKIEYMKIIHNYIEYIKSFGEVLNSDCD